MLPTMTAASQVLGIILASKVGDGSRSSRFTLLKSFHVHFTFSRFTFSRFTSNDVAVVSP